MQSVVAFPLLLAFFGGSVGAGELLLVFLVALLLFGAKSLPQIARSLGRALEEIRRAADEVRNEVTKAAREDAPTGSPSGGCLHESSAPALKPPAEGSDERVARQQ